LIRRRLNFLLSEHLLHAHGPDSKKTSQPSTSIYDVYAVARAPRSYVIMIQGSEILCAPISHYSDAPYTLIDRSWGKEFPYGGHLFQCCSHVSMLSAPAYIYTHTLPTPPQILSCHLNVWIRLLRCNFNWKAPVQYIRWWYAPKLGTMMTCLMFSIRCSAKQLHNSPTPEPSSSLLVVIVQVSDVNLRLPFPVVVASAFFLFFARKEIIY
jgi:hypothetical protein